jgi:predicted ATPase/class 3 adenylate cyclase
MTTLPSSTLTFLFSDIEGSTKLWEHYPQAMKPALAQHDAILRTAIENSHGWIIKTTGDGVHAGFSNALDATRAAVSAQTHLQAPLGEVQLKVELQLKVRMGVTTGEAELRDGDYYGTAINRAARLMSVAHGRQILISTATMELVRDQLLDGMTLRDLGEHRLKDLSRPEHIFQLCHPSLPDEFPALTTLDSFPNNLPIQLTSFIGREKEITEIQGLLNSSRLVTLTGSGGTGKTRLSQEVGVQLLADFPHGVWLVELAPLSDPAQVIPALAQVFGLQEVPSNPLANLLIDYLRAKKLLLLLDNCEHLIETCAHLADDLLHQCVGLKLLASSREALGIAGEAAYRIPSLVSEEARRLFVERARAANSRFSQTDANAASIAHICRRLDGIPLAIELAAARARLLSPDQIAARLDDRFRLLIGGSRTALPRQQTLRAMIDWSYDLLPEEERRLLRASSVFAGGWTLEALEAVSGDPAALELLEQLVNKSLVATEEHGNEMRYYLLETIRQYAREKLLDSGVDEAKQARIRHLDFFVRLAKASIPRLTGSEMIECLDELELEQDNLRAAVDWAIENDPISALRFAELLPTFWGRRLSATEGYTWVRTALARAEASVHQEGEAAQPYLEARAMALLGEAAMAFQLGDNGSARTAVVASEALSRQLNDLATLAYALALGSTICGFMGDIPTARAWSHEAIALSRRHGFAYTLATVTGVKAFLAVMTGQPVPPDTGEEVLRAARASGNPWALGMAFTNVGRMEMMAGRWAEAGLLLEESERLFQKIRDKAMANSSHSEIGHLYHRQGRHAEAAAVYRETIRTYQELNQQSAVAHQLESFGCIAVAQSQPERAARLFGAAEALRQRIQSDMTPLERREYEEITTRLRKEMEPEALAKAWTEGRDLTMEQAIQLALADQ